MAVLVLIVYTMTGLTFNVHNRIFVIIAAGAVDSVIFSFPKVVTACFGFVHCLFSADTNVGNAAIRAVVVGTIFCVTF